MALAIDIEDLLNKQKIESSRIEFKKGWNPAKKSRGQVKNHGTVLVNHGVTSRI